LYGLAFGKTRQSMLECIHAGTEFNLKHHWYEILCDKNYLSDNNVYYEITYYLCINDNSVDYNEKRTHFQLLDENKILSNIIFYILDIISINRENSIYLLKYMCNGMLDDKIINKFYEYLISPPNDPCLETENREEIIILINNFL
jgi:hypothetical protein